MKFSGVSLSALVRRRTLSWSVLPLATIVLSGCFATQQDIRVLQSDLMLMRSEAAAADSVRKVQIDKVDQAIKSLGQLTKLTDSIAAIGNRLTRFRSDMAGSMSSIEQQLLQVQEQLGQSQRNLKEVRASIEERQSQSQAQIPPAGVPGGALPVEAAPPGANELYKIGREQYNQGSYEAARTAFNELLKLYPKDDNVAQAMFYIAQSYAADRNPKAADSVYALVVSRYPKSDVAPGALFKRADAAQTAGKIKQARDLFTQVAKTYPRSDEADLARERLKALDQAD